MIRSFADKRTEDVFKENTPRGLPPDILKRALRKLREINSAAEVSDLQIAPGSRLEKLGGDRSGQWSIRVNDQWRICFEWRENDAYRVEIADYH